MSIVTWDTSLDDVVVPSRCGVVSRGVVVVVVLLVVCSGVVLMVVRRGVVVVLYRDESLKWSVVNSTLGMMYLVTV